MQNSCTAAGSAPEQGYFIKWAKRRVINKSKDISRKKLSII